MPFDIGALGQQLSGGVLGGAMGMLLGDYNDRRQYNQQERLQNLQMQGQQKMSRFNLEQQMELWNRTNYQAQKEQMKKAGLNPALLYGMSGGGGATTATQQGNVGGGNAPVGGGEVGMGIQAGMQMQLLAAQKANIEADTKNKEAQAAKTAGVDTRAVEASVQKTGMEMKDIAAGIGLKEVQKEVMEMDRDLKGLQKFREWSTMEDDIRNAKYTAQKLEYEAGILKNDKKISDETYDDMISKIKAEAVGATLTNNVLRAQNDFIKSGTAKNEQEIINLKKSVDVMNNQIWSKVNEVTQGWGKLTVDQRNAKVNELKNVLDTLKLELEAKFPAAMNVIGGMLKAGAESIDDLLRMNANQPERPTVTEYMNKKR